MTNRTGFEQTNEALWISKDPVAVLVYTFDWSDWLSPGDSINNAEYTVVARRNDPEPINIVRSGIASGNLTYVELSGGQTDKTYIVTVTVQTAEGITDAREFRVKVINRSA